MISNCIANQEIPSSNLSLASIHAPVSRLAERSMNTTSRVLSSALHSSSQGVSSTNLADKSLQMNGAMSIDDASDIGCEHLEYLLLSQEEYLEHHSEITQCKFSTSTGYLIASSDIDGVIKIWSAGPPGPPRTLATFISNSGVTSLEWMPNSDSNLLCGTTSGIIRMYDQAERKTTCEINASTDKCDMYGEALRFENSCSIQQMAVSPNGSILAASTLHHNSKPIVERDSPYDIKQDGSLVLYDLRTCVRLDEYDFGKSLLRSSTMSNSSQNVITSLTFNHNSQILTTGGNDGKIRIFDLRKRGDCIASWSVGANSNNAKSSPILTLQPSMDDTSIYTLSADGYFSIWSIVQTSQKIFGALIDDQYFTSGK